MAHAEDGEGEDRILARLARALDVPIRVFYADHGGQGGDTTLDDEVEMLRLFRKIADPRTRMLCLDFLRGISGDTIVE